MAGEGVGADHGDEALVDLEIVHVKLLQIGEAGVAGTKVVQPYPDPHLPQLVKQLPGELVGGDELALGQLQHQGDLVGGEGGEKGAAVIHQAQLLAVTGTDVEAEVEAGWQRCRMGGELQPHLLHQGLGHQDDEAALLRQRDEEIRSDQPLAVMLPAHQHLAAVQLATLADDDGLQIGDELLLDDGASELLGRGRDMAPPAVGGEAGQPSQEQDQQYDGALFLQGGGQHGAQQKSLIEAVVECRRVEPVVEAP